MHAGASDGLIECAAGLVHTLDAAARSFCASCSCCRLLPLPHRSWPCCKSESSLAATSWASRCSSHASSTRWSLHPAPHAQASAAAEPSGTAQCCADCLLVWRLGAAGSQVLLPVPLLGCDTRPPSLHLLCTHLGLWVQVIRGKTDVAADLVHFPFTACYLIFPSSSCRRGHGRRQCRPGWRGWAAAGCRDAARHVPR